MAFHYVVQKDDCLSVIAAAYGESTAKVEQDNPQFSANWDLIYVGQQVLIGGKPRKSSITLQRNGSHVSPHLAAPPAPVAPTDIHVPVGGGIGGVQNAGTIFKFLVNHGLTRTAAAGVTGNIGQESLGNPFSVGSGGCGLIGWTPCSVPVGQLWVQLDDVIKYIETNGSIGDVNMHATSPAAAADWFMTEYERCNPVYCAPSHREGFAAAVAAAEGI